MHLKGSLRISYLHVFSGFSRWQSGRVGIGTFTMGHVLSADSGTSLVSLVLFSSEWEFREETDRLVRIHSNEDAVAASKEKPFTSQSTFYTHGWWMDGWMDKTYSFLLWWQYFNFLSYFEWQSVGKLWWLNIGFCFCIFTCFMFHYLHCFSGLPEVWRDEWKTGRAATQADEAGCLAHCSLSQHLCLHIKQFQSERMLLL